MIACSVAHVRRALEIAEDFTTLPHCTITGMCTYLAVLLGADVMKTLLQLLCTCHMHRAQKISEILNLRSHRILAGPQTLL